MEDANSLMKKIFIFTEKGTLTNQLINSEAVSVFIDAITNEQLSAGVKVDLIGKLREMFREYRMLTEYFSKINSKSIYIYLIDLYLQEKNNSSLQKAILDLIDDLLINIETEKEIFDYIYQKIAVLYRGVGQLTSEKINSYLILLKHLYGDTLNAQNPKNYYSCNGKGEIKVDLKKIPKIKASHPFSIILNFKIGMNTKVLEHLDEINYTSNLLSVSFSNNKVFTVDLQYPMFIVVKSLRSGCIKSLPLEEWVVFVLTVHCIGDKLQFYIFVNGENHINKNEIANFQIDNNTYITDITFFRGFIGEVTSMSMLSQSDNTHSSVLNSGVLQIFKNYQEGLWKKKVIEKFIGDLGQHKTVAEPQNLPKRSLYSKKKEEIIKHLQEDLIFMLTPYHSKNNIIEDVIGNCTAKYTDMIRAHRYRSFQKKVSLVGGISNLLPIAEMLFLNQNILTIDILINYLNIISIIIDCRKHNMRDVKLNAFFEILSLFIERFPAQLFTNETLEALNSVGRVIFKETEDSAASIYFEHIFLNEKIISKFSQGLQEQFWGTIYRFCESDKTQIGTFVNMKKICLILRYYDDKKYSQMCCQEHLKLFKEEYVGGKGIMSPTMTAKLKHLKGIISLIIDSQTPENAATLLKLLTLDVSPCLAKFIVNIFKQAFQKAGKEWIQKLMKHLFSEKFEIIIVNTFRHTLLDVKLDILDLLYEMHKCTNNSNEKSSFSKIERMLKTCLLPEEMFYAHDKKLTSVKSVIKDLSLHCASAIKKEPTATKCTQFVGDTIVFNDNVYKEYITLVYQKLILWSVGKQIRQINIYKEKEDEEKEKEKPEDFNLIKFNAQTLKNLHIFEVLMYFTDQLRDIKFTKNLLEKINDLLSSNLNCYIVLQNDIVYCWLLNITFQNFKINEAYAYNIFECSKKLVVNVIKNSIIHCGNFSTEMKEFPIKKLNTILTWGDKMRANSNSNSFNNKIVEFIQVIFQLFLVEFDQKVKGTFVIQPKHPFSFNFFQINYMIFATFLFNFSLYYQQEPTIHANSWSYLCTNTFAIVLPEGYKAGLRVDPTNTKNIETLWNDYVFFENIMNNFSYIWSKERIYQKKNYKKMNKFLKYEDILKKIILNKDDKNKYLEELKLICFEKVSEDREMIIPLIRIIPISLANAINISIFFCKDEKQINKWIKEFKNFMLFIIIASTNATLINQQELYSTIQDKCLEAIVFGICFLKDQYFNSSLGKDKFKKSLFSILSFSMMIVKEQYNYIEGHKGLLKKMAKPARNDLTHCAVFRIFKEYVLDKTGQPLLSIDKINTYALSQYVSVVDSLNKDDWGQALFGNQILKGKIDLNYHAIHKYQLIIDKRFESMGALDNPIDETYKKEILNMVQVYETELEKYSNNSIFALRFKKNKYKKIKKYLFSWRGMWSDRDLFYNNVHTLKVRILNHYTKTFSRPCLIPILDLDYYLPNFTSFKKETLFRTRSESTIQLDMDQVFRTQAQNATEQNEKNDGANNYIKDIYRKSNSELSYIYLKISNKLDFGKDEEIINLLQKNFSASKNDATKKNKAYYLCCLVKQSHHIKGVLSLTDDNITFQVFLNQKSGNSLSGVDLFFKATDEDYDSDRKTCFGSYFVWHHKDLDISQFTINYDQINFFFRKRYYYKNSAMEIFSKYNKSYFFNFKEEDNRETVINEILSHLKEPAKIIDDLKDPKDSFDNVVGYLNQYSPNRKRIKKVKLSKQITKWTNWEISNLEMLMWFNFFSNRSYLDLSQYPVMPWVLGDYKDPLTKNTDSPDYVYRDFSLPMGMMALNSAGEVRRETFIELYESMKNEEKAMKEEGGGAVMKPYVYGSHYSNPVYVANYLTRLFPFSHIMIELQGNKFDDPDRMFLSVENSFNNSTTQKTDVRELIPEFFYLPEMFKNVNDLNMGVKENKELVNDVLTPCNNDPYYFVVTLREVLEGDHVSMNIQKWIDLIFGYKQRGKEADLAYNVFTEKSYEDLIDVKKETEKACLYRLVEFGLTPEQATAKECPTKLKKELVHKCKDLIESNNVCVFSCRSNFDKRGAVCNVIKAYMIENDKIALFFENNYFYQTKVQYSILDKVHHAEAIKLSYVLQSKLPYKISEYFNYLNYKTNHVAFYGKGKYIILGGFFDGKLIIVGMEAQLQVKDILSPFDPSPVVTIKVDKAEEYVFCGNTQGNINVYAINGLDWKLYRRIYHFKDIINDIYLSDDLNLWAASSADGYFNIYTYPCCKLIRSVKIIDKDNKEQEKTGDFIFLTSCPLPCAAVICNGEKKWEIFVYTINGIFQTRQEELSRIISPLLMKNLNSSEFLAYICKDKIHIRSLPYMYLQATIDLDTENITQLLVSENMNILYGIDANGIDIKIIKDIGGAEENIENTMLPAK